MKIVVGCLYHETNTFNPYLTDLEAFTLAEGEDALGRLASAQVMREAGVEVIPSLFMTALPSGVVKDSAYQYFIQHLESTLREHPDTDGVWLHMHGSMVAEGVPSAEVDVLARVRSIVGQDVLISLTFDAHANVPAQVFEDANIIRSYRSVPHIDQQETERITAQLLIDSLNNGNRPVIAYRHLPLIICGEKAVGNKAPLKDIFARIGEVEQQPAIATASFYIGHVWADSRHTGASIGVVAATPADLPEAQRACDELAALVMSREQEFDFDARTLSVPDAWQEAIAATVTPVYISDTGDNTTAGASGRSTQILQWMLARPKPEKRVLLAGITAPEAFTQVVQLEAGQQTRVTLAKTCMNDTFFDLDVVVGVQGELLGYLNAEHTVVGRTALVSHGNFDIILLERSESFITLNHFARAGINRADYDILVVKQGYLFPQLEADAALALQALSGGDTQLVIKDLEYHNIDSTKKLI